MIKGFKATAMNRLWVADITYIDTDEGALYLHLLTDAFTHEIIGRPLSQSIMAENTISALRMGMVTPCIAPPRPGFRSQSLPASASSKPSGA